MKGGRRWGARIEGERGERGHQWNNKEGRGNGGRKGFKLFYVNVYAFVCT